VIKPQPYLYLGCCLTALLLAIAKTPAQTPTPMPVPSPSPSPSPPQVVVQPQPVRPLPGGLDRILTFNSNSPEVVQTEGILLSTFPKIGMKVPDAHLNLPLKGRFDLFVHHIAKATSPEDLRTLYLGLILSNPGKSPVTVNLLQAASHLSQPDAPFMPLPSMQDNSAGLVFAGPGDRAMNDVLRGQRQPGWPAQIMIPPGQSQMLMNLPIPVKGLTPPLNGRSTLIRVNTNGPVYAASLGMFAPTTPDGSDRPPTLEEWQTLLQTSGLAGPRDKTPTPPNAPGKLIYGRVAGVAKGSRWLAQVTDTPQRDSRLTIPEPGAAFSYVLSSVAQGTFGTGQVQSAPMIVRYPDTAYEAHGNYGIEYSLNLPLYNSSAQPQQVSLTLQTPLKTDQATSNLRFNQPPPARVFFRGTVRLRYKDDQGTPQTRFLHLVQQQGQQAQPLVTLTLPAQGMRLVEVDFLYPPDATPPQVLTIQTLGS
jgi:Protein of unknown function (DUF3370)